MLTVQQTCTQQEPCDTQGAEEPVIVTNPLEPETVPSRFEPQKSDRRTLADQHAATFVPNEHSGFPSETV
jgi:hypothetical protein